MIIPLAHAAHWLPYVIPAVIVLGGVLLAAWRERRERRRGEQPLR